MNARDFKNLIFNTFDKENILLNNFFDPDSIFFFFYSCTNTTYFTPETLKNLIKENDGISFSVLNLKTFIS